VILGTLQDVERLAIDQAKYRDFATLEPLLHHHGVAGVAEPAFEHHVVEDEEGVGRVFANHDAFSRG
jgi:hypothetical protein